MENQPQNNPDQGMSIQHSEGTGCGFLLVVLIFVFLINLPRDLVFSLVSLFMIIIMSIFEIYNFRHYNYKIIINYEGIKIGKEDIDKWDNIKNFEIVTHSNDSEFEKSYIYYDRFSNRRSICLDNLDKGRYSILKAIQTYSMNKIGMPN